MNYQHQAHAANLSDIVKHLCLSSLRHWPGLETIWDAYAAAPVSPWSQLVKRHVLLDALMGAKGPAVVTEFQQTVAECRLPAGEKAYPGSSSILAGFDAVHSLLLTDTEPLCIEAQKEWFAAYRQPRVEALVMDVALSGNMVLARQPDLVFIDPPFLQQQEWRIVFDLIEQIRHSLPATRIVLWYPLRDDLVMPEVVNELPGLHLQAEYPPGQGLKGCGMMMLNFETGLEELLAPLAAWLRGSNLPGIARVAWGA